jgi:hypothetical protein
MANFATRIKDLTSFDADTSAKQASVNDWLTSGSRTVLNILPIDMLVRIAGKDDFTAAIDVEGKKIISVLRKDENNSGTRMPCRLLPPSMMGRVADTNYMEAASSSDPAYIIFNNELNTFPASDSSNDSRLIAIDTSITVAYTESVISNFPDEAEEAVVLYASRNSLQRLLNDVHSSLSNLNIVAVSPSSPALGTISYTDATNADASVTDVANILVDSIEEVDPTGSVPTFTAPDLNVDVSTFSTFLEVEEDTELAQIQLGRLNNEVTQYQANIQKEVAVFNKENVRYQAELQDELAKHNSNLQRAITSAQIASQKAQSDSQQATSTDIANKAADQALSLQNAVQNMQAQVQDNTALITKYSADLQEYQAEVQKEIQEYTQNLQKDSVKYEWYSKQYQMIDAQYKEQIQLLQGGK